MRGSTRASGTTEVSVDSSLIDAAPAAPAASRMGWLDQAWAFARAKPLGAAGALIIVAMLLVAALAQPLAPYDPYQPDYAAQFSRPAPELVGSEPVIGRGPGELARNRRVRA